MPTTCWASCPSLTSPLPFATTQFGLSGVLWPEPVDLQAITKIRALGVASEDLVNETTHGVVWDLQNLCCVVRFWDRPTGAVYKGGSRPSYMRDFGSI